MDSGGESAQAHQGSRGEGIGVAGLGKLARGGLTGAGDRTGRITVAAGGSVARAEAITARATVAAGCAAAANATGGTAASGGTTVARTAGGAAVAAATGPIAATVAATIAGAVTARGAAAGFPVGIDQAGRQRIHTVTKLILVVREGIQRAVGKVGKRRDIGDHVARGLSQQAKDRTEVLDGAERDIDRDVALLLDQQVLEVDLDPLQQRVELIQDRPVVDGGAQEARERAVGDRSTLGIVTGELDLGGAVSTHAGQVSSPCRWSP